MKEVTELLKRIITQDVKYVESMRRSLKDDEFTIIRLQNKTRNLEKKIEELKKLIKECSCHLRLTDTGQPTIPLEN